MIAAAIFAAGVVLGTALGLWWALRSRTTPPAAPAHIPSAISLGGNVSAEAINHEWQQRCFHEMSKNTFFEIRY